MSGAMLRILLAAALLGAALFAAQPASASPTCETIAYNPLWNQTVGLACGSVDCYFNAPAPTCALSHPGAARTYVLCYGHTGPLDWVPDCT
jgi:hypothetical protein